MIEFKLPELGENISAGDVMRVLVKPGDTVANDQAVLELETDKATIEVPSSVAGTVNDVKVKQGEKVKVGQVIFTVDEAGGGATKADASKDDAAKPKPQPAGAPEEGGMSQAATAGRDAPTAGDDHSGADDAKADREGDKPGVADQPAAQVAPSERKREGQPGPRLPEDELEGAPRQKRGEVV